MSADTMAIDSRQDWSAEGYARNARFVSDLGQDILEWLDPRPGDLVLDLGCGDGALSVRIMDAGTTVIGIDSSPDMVARAVERGVDARVMDGQSFAFPSPFDAVFSNAALHWMPDATAVARNIARALRPGGRLVAEFGGHGNVAAIVTAMRAVAMRHAKPLEQAMPWYFPTESEYRRVLESVGLSVVRAQLVPRPTPLPTGIEGWLDTFRPGFFDLFGEARKDAIEEVAALLEPSLRDTGGTWWADYVRLRVEAVASAG